MGRRGGKRVRPLRLVLLGVPRAVRLLQGSDPLREQSGADFPLLLEAPGARDLQIAAAVAGFVRAQLVGLVGFAGARQEVGVLILLGAVSPVRAGRRGLPGGRLGGRLHPHRGLLAFLPAVHQRFPPGARAARAAAVGHGRPRVGAPRVGKASAAAVPLSRWSPASTPLLLPLLAAGLRGGIRGSSRRCSGPPRLRRRQCEPGALGSTWRRSRGSPASLGRCARRNLRSLAKRIVGGGFSWHLRLLRAAEAPGSLCGGTRGQCVPARCPGECPSRSLAQRPCILGSVPLPCPHRSGTAGRWDLGCSLGSAGPSYAPVSRTSAHLLVIRQVIQAT